MEPSSRPLYLVCTRREVCNLLNRTLSRKHVAARRGNEWDRDLTHVKTGVHGWHKAGMLQHYQPATHHVTTWSCYLIIIRTHPASKLTCSLSCMHITFTNAYINMPWEKLLKQTCKTLIISKVQTCLPGSEKSESSSAKFAAPSPLPDLRHSEKSILTWKPTCAEKLFQFFFK